MSHKTICALTILIITLIGSALLFNQLINHSRPKTTLQYKVENAFPNLSFDHPDGIYFSGDETNRLSVIGQMGIIYVFDNLKTAEMLLKPTFFLTSVIVCTWGFLGINIRSPNLRKTDTFMIITYLIILSEP
jgi:hypothetical protein